MPPFWLRLGLVRHRKLLCEEQYKIVVIIEKMTPLAVGMGRQMSEGANRDAEEKLHFKLQKYGEMNTQRPLNMYCNGG